jgi:hypothetical protein
MTPTAASEIGSLQDAGFSKSQATSYVSSANFGGASPGRTHFMDETDLLVEPGLPDVVDGLVPDAHR